MKRTERREVKQQIRDEIQVELGKLIVELRNKADFTQEELAFEAGIDRSFMSKLERGVTSINLVTLIMLARKLEEKPSEILRILEERLENSGNEEDL